MDYLINGVNWYVRKLSAEWNAEEVSHLLVCEQLYIALALKRDDHVAELGFTMEAALERLGATWRAHLQIWRPELSN